jgi:hypothetical protein
MKMLAMCDREHPIVMPPFCWKKLSSTSIYVVLKQNFWQYHGSFQQFKASSHLRTETDPVSETVYSLDFQNIGREAKSKTSVILNVIDDRQNPLESTSA